MSAAATPPPSFPAFPLAAPITIYFDFCPHLPNQAGTWGAVFYAGPADHHRVGGLLPAHTASEDGALNELLRLIHALNLPAAQLYTDHPNLVARRAAELPTAFTLATCHPTHPGHRQALEEAQRQQEPYTTVHRWGQRQHGAGQHVPPQPTGELQCRYRLVGQALYLDLCISGLPDTLRLGRQHAPGQFSVDAQETQTALHHHLLRIYGPALAPHLPRLEELIWKDFQHRQTELTRHPCTAWATPPGVQKILLRAGVITPDQTFQCRRAGRTNLRLSYGSCQTIRTLTRPQRDWAHIVRQLMRDAGATDHDLLQFQDLYTQQVLDLLQEPQA